MLNSLGGYFSSIKVQISLPNARSTYCPEDALVHLWSSVPIMSLYLVTWTALSSERWQPHLYHFCHQQKCEEALAHFRKLPCDWCSCQVVKADQDPFSRLWGHSRPPPPAIAQDPMSARPRAVNPCPRAATVVPVPSSPQPCLAGPTHGHVSSLGLSPSPGRWWMPQGCPSAPQLPCSFCSWSRGTPGPTVPW